MGGAQFVARRAGTEERSDNSSSFCSSRIYDIFLSDKPMGDMIKRATKYGTSVLLHVLTAAQHTQTHSVQITRPLKAVAIQCDEAGDEFTEHTQRLLIFLLFLSIYIHFMHKFSLKITVSACGRNSWEDTIAVLLLWKILTWKCFLCKNAQYVRFLGLKY